MTASVRESIIALDDVVIYSAIFGGYDRPKPVPADVGVRCIMFTDDSELYAPGWDIVVGDPPDSAGWSSMMKHKWFKLHPHKALRGVRISMWIDGSMTILVNDYVQRCLTSLGEDDWVMVRHPARNCVYDEAVFSASLTRYDGPALLQQMEYYRSIGFPAQWGLMATGANVRRHTKTVMEVCEHWWYENLNRSHQDQLSLPVLMWLTPDLKYNWNMPWFDWWHLSEHDGWMK